MDAKVICVVLSFVVLAAAGPVVDDTNGHIDNSVRFIFHFFDGVIYWVVILSRMRVIAAREEIF